MVDITERYGHVDIPTNNNAFLEFVGLAFDTGIVFEDELEVGCRTFLDHKVDKYFYVIVTKSCTIVGFAIYLSSECI